MPIEGNTPDPKPFILNGKAPVKSLAGDRSARLLNLASTQDSRQIGAFNLQEKLGTSQYDYDLIPQVDQYTNRAYNQGHWARLRNQTVKTPIGIGLGILENAGYLGELVSYLDPEQTKDYSNALTEWAIGRRQDVDKALPNYIRQRELTGIKTLSDPTWWFEYGQGLSESVGEFLVTGATVGGALGKGAKALNSIIGSKLLQAGVTGAAQLGTSASLAYTEGAMSGARIFQDTYNNELRLGTPENVAKERAATAASKTVQLNTILNTGLNLTSVSPIFKTMENINAGTKFGLNRLSKESLGAYATRLDDAVKQGYKQESLKRSLLFEALQEGIEEDVNLFAEGEGRIEGGLKKKEGTAISRFLSSTFSSEGALNFFLGSVGGIAQTGGINLIPYRKVQEGDQTKLINNRELERRQNNEAIKNFVGSLKQDIKYLTDNQKELSKAVAANNEDDIIKYRNNLFNVGALKSIREGNGDEFVQDLRQIASTDNTKIGEDGKTDAQRLGYSDALLDNKYKETAAKKIADVTKLQEEYRTLSRRFEDPYVADQAFRKRLDVYSTNTTLEEYQAKLNNLEAESQEMMFVPQEFNYIKMLSQEKALNQLLKEVKNPTIISQITRERNQLSKLIEEHKEANKDISKVTFGLSKVESENKGLINELSKAYLPQQALKVELEQQKKEYKDILKAPKQFETEKLAEKDKAIKAIQSSLGAKASKAQKEKQDKEATQKSEEHKEFLEEEREATNAPSTTRTKYKNAFITQEGNKVKVQDEDGIKIGEFNTEDEAKAFVDKSTTTSTPDTPIPADTKQTDSTNLKSILSFHGKSKEEKEKEKDILVKELEANNLPNSQVTGFHNKVAYKAQEQNNEGKTADSSFINPDYLILHSTEINTNTEVTIKLAKESPFYKEDDKVDTIAMGIYYNDKLIGYVPRSITPGQLLTIRKAVIARGGEVKSKIIAKDLGVINNGERQDVLNAMPNITEFGIGRNGQLEKYPDQAVKDLTNKETTGYQSGFVYAVLPTPNGKRLAVPLDIKKINTEKIESIQLAINMFIMKDKLGEAEKKVVSTIFDNYSIDLTTSIGLRDYINSLMYTEPELTDLKRIKQINEEVGKDKYYFNVTGTGVQFIKSGAAYKQGNKLVARELGINTPDALVGGLLDELGIYLKEGAYAKVDLLKIKDNNEFSYPLLSISKDDQITFKDVTRDTYADYIRENTTTNIFGIKINDNEYTYFVQPSLYFDYGFVEGDQKKIESIENTGQTAILAPNPQKKKLSTTTKGLGKTKEDNSRITDKDVDERKKYCI